MSSRALTVFHEGTKVGVLRQTDEAELRFWYADSWLSSPESFPISLRMPLRGDAFGGEAAAFFPNLLPEGNVRLRLARRLGLSVENDFDLLAAVGGECAGALTLLPEGQAPAAESTSYREISARDLVRLADGGGALPMLDGTEGLRLSLAGAQDKVPVRMDGERILLPQGTAPSTHILKFESRDFKHLPANEVFTLMLARALAVSTVEATLLPVGRRSVLLVERYDRREEGSAVRRLHQEDLCQALAVPPARKYEKEGGPSFAECFAAVAQTSIDPAIDARAMLRWLAFNVMALNADGHAKNLSILYREGGCVLAPAYDLVCTRAYPSLARALAMSVSGESDPTLLLRRHWEALAGTVGVGARFTIELVAQMADAMPSALREATREFRERYADSPALQLIVPKIRAQARRIAKQLERS